MGEHEAIRPPTLSRPAPRCRVGTRAAFLLLVLVVLTGCDLTMHGVSAPTVPPWARGNGPRVAAVMTRHFLQGRVVGIVDVTREFHDKSAEGAFVLVDRLVGTRLPRDDYRRRPVLAVYPSWQAAKQAAARAPGDARWRGSSVVLFLPPEFPARLGKRYEKASSIGFM